MLDMSNDKRVVFPSGKQRTFIESIEKDMSVPEIARLCDCSERAVRDWRREKFSMPVAAVEILAKRAGVSIPRHSLRDAYAHTKAAGAKGAASLLARYGRVPVDEQYRRAQWKAWWDAHGKQISKLPNDPKPIRKPRKDTRLAEFVGIMMGDGGMSRYQATISLNQDTDSEFSEYVIRRIEELFDVTPGVRDHPRQCVRTIVISRIKLVRYLNELGIPIGDKIRQGLDLPAWIRTNHKFAIACVRGLIDTDGCIIIHRYRVKGKWYVYKKLSFTSASRPLIKSVYDVLKEQGLKPRLSKAGKDVLLDSKADMKRYFSLIGTSNPKHLKRYESEVG